MGSPAREPSPFFGAAKRPRVFQPTRRFTGVGEPALSAANKIKPWYRRHDDWWYVTRSVDGRRQQVKLVRGSSNEAAAYERFYELMAAAGHVEPSTEITFNELAAKFLKASLRENSAKTTAWYAHFLDDFDHAYEGRVVDLKKSHVESWLEDHPDWGKSTRRQAITALRRAVNWGFEEGHLREFPIGLRKLRRPKMGKRETLISEADHKRMLAATDVCFRDFLTALWETGARPEEVRTVTSEMFISKAGVWLFKAHKTAEKTERPRTIYLTLTMVALTKRLAEVNPQGPLFRNSQGRPWTTNAVRWRMKRLREKLDLPKGTVAYAYRHTYATTGLERGASIADMAELMGHSDTKMLSDHYGHLSARTGRMRDIAGRITATQEAKSEG